MRTDRFLLFIIFVSFSVFYLIPVKAEAQLDLKTGKMKRYFYAQPNAGISQYFGDINLNDFWSQTPKFGAGIIGGYQISPVFGTRIQFLKTNLYSEKTDQNQKLTSDLWDAALHLTVNIVDIFAGYNENRLFNFYLFAGGGVSAFKSKLEAVDPPSLVKEHSTRQYTFFLPIGAGASIRITNYLSANIEYGDRTIFNPTILDFYDGGKGNNDHYSYASAGLQLKFGMKDTDGDGIRDKDDICVTTPGKIKLAGCPDKDNDGIPDKDDLCPDNAGKAEFKGCPDTDGDNIPDKDDACPGEAGKAELKGCPDKDGDGIADKDDKCPDAAGKAEFAGCPDRDGDGIIDKDDACPDVKGLPKYAGCPDTDGDGIPDNLDKCPDVAGIAANFGCPEIVAGPLLEKNVYFNSDDSNPLQKNMADLDEIVAFANEHPGAVITVSGHADNRESDEYNMRLSEKRADNVISYLKKKGITAIKIDKLFYGRTQPVADNNTTGGRALNRRVEIKITK